MGVIHCPLATNRLSYTHIYLEAKRVLNRKAFCLDTSLFLELQRFASCGGFRSTKLAKYRSGGWSRNFSIFGNLLCEFVVI